MSFTYRYFLKYHTIAMVLKILLYIPLVCLFFETLHTKGM